MPRAERQRVRRQSTVQERKAARRGISLRGAGLGPRTEARYLSALALLLPFIEVATHEEEINDICEEWIEQQWSAGVPLGSVGDALCAVHFYWPDEGQTSRSMEAV